MLSFCAEVSIKRGRICHPFSPASELSLFCIKIKKNIEIMFFFYNFSHLELVIYLLYTAFKLCV